MIENILRVNRYTVQITREKIFTAAIIGPLFVILSVVMSIEMKAPERICGGENEYVKWCNELCLNL